MHLKLEYNPFYLRLVAGRIKALVSCLHKTKESDTTIQTLMGAYCLPSQMKENRTQGAAPPKNCPEQYSRHFNSP